MRYKLTADALQELDEIFNILRPMIENNSEF